MLIVLEGIEGSGKSTQIRLLSERLTSAGIPAVSFREPGGTPVGDAIRKILLHPENEISPAAESLLFMASRAELIEREVRPALKDRIVLLDRFFLSTYAYQVKARGLPEEEVRAANRLATGGLVPDVTFLLALPSSEGMRRADSRGARDRMESTGAAFHQSVAEAFELFAGAAWQRDHPECGPVESVDATGDEKSVAAAIVASLIRRFPSKFAGLEPPS